MSFNMTNLFAKLALLAGISGTCLCQAHAVTIPFDPDGGGNSFIAIDNMDFAPGNGLFQGISSLSDNNNRNTLTNLTIQARLGTLNSDINGDVTPAGLNNSYEITVFLSVPVFANINGNDTIFTITPGNSVFELWYDSGLNASDLAGIGFRNGTKILDGTLGSADGIFTKSTRPLMPLDQHVFDNYPGVLTESVVGGGSFEVNVVSADPGFFGIVPPSLYLSLFNTSFITPFDTADPSALFDGYTPNIGSVNGRGRDFQVLTDANASFVPEPSTWILAALVASGLGVAGLRRNAR